jgi:hypothetical protein
LQPEVIELPHHHFPSIDLAPLRRTVIRTLGQTGQLSKSRATASDPRSRHLVDAACQVREPASLGNGQP